MQVPFKYYQHGCRRILPVCLLLVALLFLDVLLPRVIDGSEGGAAFGVGFDARSSLSCRKTVLVSLRTMVFFFPLVTFTFSLSTPIEPFDS